MFSSNRSLALACLVLFIPRLASAEEGQTPITSLPAVITTNGSFFLDSSIAGTFVHTGPDPAITIQSGVKYVSIDLTDHIILVDPSGEGIFFEDTTHARVRNGAIIGGQHGVNWEYLSPSPSTGSSPRHLLIEDFAALDMDYTGVRWKGIAAPGEEFPGREGRLVINDLVTGRTTSEVLPIGIDVERASMVWVDTFGSHENSRHLILEDTFDVNLRGHIWNNPNAFGGIPSVQIRDGLPVVRMQSITAASMVHEQTFVPFLDLFESVDLFMRMVNLSATTSAKLESIEGHLAWNAFSRLDLGDAMPLYVHFNTFMVGFTDLYPWPSQVIWSRNSCPMQVRPDCWDWSVTWGLEPPAPVSDASPYNNIP
ncbi:MAG: hypothetical protein AAFV53_39390 [Myxococcota bacterium]